MNAIEDLRSDSNTVISLMLGIAQQATQALSAQGVTVIAAMAHNRRPLLMVDRMPDGVPSAMKVRHSNGRGGMYVIYAASAYGCQLEMQREECQGAQTRAGAPS